MFIRLLAFLLLVSAILPAFPAEVSSGPDPRSREIVIDVIARDRHGRLVRDLSADEVDITDEGVAVKPAAFRLVGPAPGVGAVPKRPRLITLLFERFGPDGRALAREGALALLKSVAGPDVYFAILGVGANIRLIQPFTQDVRLVQAGIVRATSGSRRRETEPDLSKLRSTAAGAGADADSTLARMLLRIVDPPSTAVREARGNPSIRTLLSIAREERGTSGRKTLVYFCDGLQVPESQRRQFLEIVENANRANLAIYPIDVSGLSPERSAWTMTPSMGLSVTGAVQLADRGVALGRVQEMGARRVVAGQSSEDTRSPALTLLATRTGGFLPSDGRLRKQARRIAEEALNYYEITYVPPESPLDGRYRPVEITIGRPKVAVQSPSGYLALPLVEGRPPQVFELKLLNELAANPARHDFYHAAAAIPMRAVAGGLEYAILVESSLGDLEFQDDAKAGVCRAHGAALAVLRDASGKIVERFARDNPFLGPIERKDSYRAVPWLLEQRAVLPPGTYTLETMVSDLGSGRASVQRRNLVVETWGPGPHVSALTYVRSVVASSRTARRVFQSTEKAIDPLLELRLAGGEGAAATVFFTVVGAEGLADPVKVELGVSRAGEEVARGLVFDGVLKEEAALLSKLDAGSLAGGEYELFVTATQAGRSFTSALPLTVQTPQQAGVGGPVRKLNVAAKKAEEWDSPPPSAEQQKLVEAARSRALGYAKRLPNLVCLQTTRRLEDPTGEQEWRQKDEYSEVITWYNGVESYNQVTERSRTKDKRADKVRVSSAGEFGSLLRDVFVPETKADFRWIRSESVGDRPAEVFSYRVAAENSQYNVYYVGKRTYHAKPSYHGIVTIDTNTAEVLHLEAEMGKMPEEIKLDRLTLNVDYDTASIGGQDFLLPSAASLTTTVGQRHLVRNEMRFSGYRRFEAESKIQYGAPPDPAP